ncbi:MAG TPA: SRPBCC family protein [Chitinophagaceae bacterium]
MFFVYIFIGLVVLLLIIAAVMPKTYNIEKSIVIHRPVNQVMDNVGNLNFYSQWNPWQQSDPTTKATITGSPKTPGHQYAWQGKKVGVGSLTLRDLDNKHIHFDLQFFKPWKSKAKDNWLFEPWGASDTKVTWQNSGEFPWPIASLMGPLISKNLNHQFQQGLNNLKKMCEA